MLTQFMVSHYDV